MALPALLLRGLAGLRVYVEEHASLEAFVEALVANEFAVCGAAGRALCLRRPDEWCGPSAVEAIEEHAVVSGYDAQRLT